LVHLLFDLTHFEIWVLWLYYRDTFRGPVVIITKPFCIDWQSAHICYSDAHHESHHSGQQFGMFHYHIPHNLCHPYLLHHTE
jgi:hypothetical protein